MESQVLQRASSEPWSALRNVILKAIPPRPGVPEHDVFEMLSDEDYDTFYKAVCGGARLARAAYDSADIEESVNLLEIFLQRLR